VRHAATAVVRAVVVEHQFDQPKDGRELRSEEGAIFQRFDVRYVLDHATSGAHHRGGLCASREGVSR